MRRRRLGRGLPCRVIINTHAARGPAARLAQPGARVRAAVPAVEQSRCPGCGSISRVCGPATQFSSTCVLTAWRLSGARCGMEDLNRASCQSRISGTSCNTGRFDERAANDARCDCGSRIAGHMKCLVPPQAACSGDASQRKSRFVHEVGIARAVRHSRNDSRVRHLGRRRQRPQAPRSGGATS